MKLLSITCPHCGARLQATPNAKMLTCDYCNGDFMLDDEVKRFHLQDAEQAGYELEKGRERTRQEADLAEANAECLFCGKDIVVDSRHADCTCCYCNKVMATEPAICLAEAHVLEHYHRFEQALELYEKALKLSPNNYFAAGGVERTKDKMKNHVFIRAKALHIFSDDAYLYFTKDAMIYTKIDVKIDAIAALFYDRQGERGRKPKIKEEVFLYSKMKDFACDDNGNISFYYPGHSSIIKYLCDVEGNAISDFVKNAQKGILPTEWHVDYKLKSRYD